MLQWRCGRCNRYLLDYDAGAIVNGKRIKKVCERCHAVNWLSGHPPVFSSTERPSAPAAQKAPGRAVHE